MRTSEANYRCLLLLLLLTGGERRREFEEHDICVLELILVERPDGHAPIQGHGQEAQRSTLAIMTLSGPSSVGVSAHVMLVVCVTPSV
jgi:hypothetical protein